MMVARERLVQPFEDRGIPLMNVIVKVHDSQVINLRCPVDDMNR